MAIVDTILSTPVDIAALQVGNKTREALCDGAFTNLLYYAKVHWSYTASGSTGGDDLLAGTAVASPCGGIATALRRVFVNGLHIPDADVEYIRVTGYLWTGPNYLCYDPKVRGNLRRLDTPGNYGNGCIFNEHYYLKCNGKYYDPCLSTTYSVKNQSIKEEFNGLYQNTAYGTGQTAGRMLLTADKKTCIVYLSKEPVPGFRGAWGMFEASKKNVEKALGGQLFRAEMAVQGGNTQFAKAVNTLP
jgi:hypothetical protein